MKRIRKNITYNAIFSHQIKSPKERRRYIYNYIYVPITPPFDEEAVLDFCIAFGIGLPNNAFANSTLVSSPSSSSLDDSFPSVAEVAVAVAVGVVAPGVFLPLYTPGIKSSSQTLTTANPPLLLLECKMESISPVSVSPNIDPLLLLLPPLLLLLLLLLLLDDDDCCSTSSATAEYRAVDDDDDDDDAYVRTEDDISSCCCCLMLLMLLGGVINAATPPPLLLLLEVVANRREASEEE